MTDKTIIIYVRGIYCRQCPEIIMSSLLQTRGILDVSIKYFKSEITIIFDPNIISRKAIEKILTDLGYPVCNKNDSGTNPILNSLKKII